MRKILFTSVLIMAFLMFPFIDPGPAEANPAGIAAAIAGGIILNAVLAAAWHPYPPPPGPCLWGPPPPPGPRPWGPPSWAPGAPPQR